MKIDKATTDRMSSSMDKIVSLAKSVRSTEETLNSERTSLCVQILDWIHIATESGAVATIRQCYQFIATRTKISANTIHTMHKIGAYIDKHALDPKSVVYNSVRHAISYTMPEATRLQVDAAVRRGESAPSVRRTIMRDKTVAASMTGRRAKKIVESGKATKAHVRIEVLAVQTMANEAFGTETIITITDRNYVPLMTVGRPNPVRV